MKKSGLFLLVFFISFIFIIGFVSSLEYNVKDYGAKGDGKTDDTLAIQNALDDAGKNPGSKVIVPAGTYMVDAVKRLYIKSYTHLSLDKNAILKAITNDQDKYFILYINKSEEGFIRISGGKIEGDKGRHKGDLPDGGGAGMGIGMYGKKNIVIENITIINTFGDGIYFGEALDKTNENILIRNVLIQNCGRNAVSIKTIKNFFVDNLTSKSTYLYSVDFEPNKEVLEKGALDLDNIIMKKIRLNKKMTILGRDKNFSFYVSDATPSGVDFRCKEEYRNIYGAYGLLVYNGVSKECYCNLDRCPPKTAPCNLNYKCDAGENEQNCYFDCVDEALWTMPVQANIVSVASLPCNLINYSNWSACVNGIQTRTELSRLPLGCVGDSILVSSCLLPCLGSNWQSSDTSCLPSNTLTRTWTKMGNCNETTGITKPLSEIVSCEYIPNVKTCNNFTYSNWSNCSVNGIQNRTLISSFPVNCSGGNPILTQSCTLPCLESNWQASDSSCLSSNIMIRLWTKIGICNETEGINKVSSQVINCTFIPEIFSYSNDSDFNLDYDAESEIDQESYFSDVSLDDSDLSSQARDSESNTGLKIIIFILIVIIIVEIIAYFSFKNRTFVVSK